MTNKKATHAAAEASTENKALAPTSDSAQVTQTPSATAVSETAPVVSTPAASAPRDPDTGRGGLYTMKDGVRQLVERTQASQA